MKKIKKILIANRGEIAVRIIQAAKELGILTVCIYSKVDRLALHVLRADEAFLLENNGIEPYLDVEQILKISSIANVDAIHPGYGFLSENFEFAKRVVECGFLFIGPTHQAIEMMGDKLRAKDTAINANVPVIPGFEIKNGLDATEIKTAKKLGFPLLIKARAGGGGKGMRIVHSEEELHQQITLAVREAKEAFGNGAVFIEKFIIKPRHIEIQILADNYGNAVHLFERECSIQRRHQKVIEEAPSAVLNAELRKEMGNAAIRLVKACHYSNAGTLEFVIDKDKNFYFLEMNTRLQVEHPVTEFITGLDLVKQQIRIAEGESLGLSQNDIKINGHAIELRVYAEDPKNSFLPDVGKLRDYSAPKGIGVRVDDGYENDMEIPVEYDPLLAKLIVHGKTRHEAISRMKRAISEYEIDGVKNTLEFGNWVMSDQDFCSGNYNTGFISTKIDQFVNEESDKTYSMIAGIATYEFVEKFKTAKINNKPILQSKWRERSK